MKKYGYAMIVCLISILEIKGGIPESLKSGATQLENAPKQLQELVTSLNSMYDAINKNIPKVNEGINKSKAALPEITKAKNEISKNEAAPEDIKNKIVQALTNLEIALPKITLVLSNLKNTMNTIAQEKTGKVSDIQKKITRIQNLVNGSDASFNVPLGARLRSLAKAIDDIFKIKDFFQKDVKQGFETAGKEIKKGAETAGKEIKKGAETAGKEIKKGFKKLGSWLGL